MGVGDHVLPEASSFSHLCRTGSEEATRELGHRIAGLLQGGEIVLLNGDLGLGKTCLVQGIGAGLAVDAEVVSPTFTLVNTYVGRLVVHHLDFYRLDAGHDLADVGVPDILSETWDGGAVCLVEWPEPLLPEVAGTEYVELLGTLGAGPTDRLWHLRGFPAVPAAWQEVFAPKGNGTC